MNCHTAENLGLCHEDELFRDWKCKELKAKLFVDLIDNPYCMDELYKYHPNFSEYYKYCLKAQRIFGEFLLIGIFSLYLLLLML